MFLLHLAATLFMTGLIWFVQVVHYPLFAGVPGEAFIPYTARHQRLTGFVVGPVMGLELATAIGLFWSPDIPRLELWLGLGLLGIIWLSTALVQVPRHSRLGRGYDAGVIGELVNSNWLRTAAWTLRAGLVLLWAGRLMN